MSGASSTPAHRRGPPKPRLSAIVISHDDEHCIERTVRSVVDQDCPFPFEVIVVTSGSDRTADVVRRAFPTVRVVQLDGDALPGRARNAGLTLAQGDYISFPGSHVELRPGSLAARVRAHELGYAMVSGVKLNGTDTRAGWASYFLDHAYSLPGRPSCRLTGPPGSCSYSKEALSSVDGFPEDMRAGEDTVVNQALFRRGWPAYRSSEVVLVHHSPCRTVAHLVGHHFQRGRAAGRIALDGHGSALGLLRSPQERHAWGPSYVGRRLLLARRGVERWDPDRRDVYRSVAPLVAVGAFAAWMGFWYELFHIRSAAADRPRARAPTLAP